MENFTKPTIQGFKATESKSGQLKKLLAVLTLLTIGFAKPATSQCIAPTLSFNSPQLIAGTDGTIGAVYLFPNVIPGVDAQITILDLVGGASLAEIDNTTGAGYYDAFQPYMWAGANDTSYIDWKITFKIAGSNTDTTLECLAVTAIDVDGDNSALQEFVEAATPGSFAVDPFTNLFVSFDGVRSKALGQITTIPLIDTAARQAMFQMNFTNINSLLYRNGAITTAGAQIRQTCIYFAPFFYTWSLLPVKLLSFTATPQDGGTKIEWFATREQDNKTYTLQKSSDGIKWKDLTTSYSLKYGTANNYNYFDSEKSAGVVYYRLKQTATSNTISYSKVIRAGQTQQSHAAISNNTFFTNEIMLVLESKIAETYTVQLVSVSGQSLQKKQLRIQTGTNKISLQALSSLPSGMYVLAVTEKSGRIIHQSKVYKQ